jgi:hypothetical protein
MSPFDHLLPLNEKVAMLEGEIGKRFKKDTEVVYAVMKLSKLAQQTGSIDGIIAIETLVDRLAKKSRLDGFVVQASKIILFSGYATKHGTAFEDARRRATT